MHNERDKRRLFPRDANTETTRIYSIHPSPAVRGWSVLARSNRTWPIGLRSSSNTQIMFLIFTVRRFAQVQITTLCVSISLSATVALLCLFVPKLHIIAFQSDKNVRKLTMNTSAGGGMTSIKKSISSNVSTENVPSHRPPSVMASHKRFSGCASTSRAGISSTTYVQLSMTYVFIATAGACCKL